MSRGKHVHFQVKTNPNKEKLDFTDFRVLYSIDILIQHLKIIFAKIFHGRHDLINGVDLFIKSNTHIFKFKRAQK